ncbi:DNA-directed RNA polymerase sigma-70 factor [Parapedobacter pyrenivorans]|uniref:DNA-directed RNA polymerase sigma-70 factor n=1 Tax=Parapedobacter pyrenivorans TaxID=1305674 RepID=A0A917HER0_9SPHI|nr:RNA polymerase sigma-70 factor [Parapedobacter pyrenivorans]GGG76791.1 DNA-directed RNA polymerase sigma-70 factor [Parapedobacter pyrenivorans]
MDQSYYSKDASSDEALVLRIQQGDRDAFASFYGRHRANMYLVAYHLLRDEDDAQDAVQELFSKVWQQADRIDTTGNIKGYLYTVLRNRILTGMARSKHLDEYINSYLAFERQSVSTTEETVLVRELEQLLEEKVNELPPKMREVYEFSWNENLTNKEIAKRMAISEGTVKQHKHQAMRMLRGKLERLVCVFPLFF